MSQAGPSAGKALARWQEKKGAFEYDLAICSDSARKYELRKLIEECEQQVDRLQAELGRMRLFPPEERDAILAELARLVKDVKTRDLREADETRWVGRKEWFGAVLYDREKGDYIPFDKDAALIFRLSQQIPPSELFELLRNRAERQSFDTFVQLCQSIDILDAKGAFQRLSRKIGQQKGTSRRHCAYIFPVPKHVISTAAIASLHREIPIVASSPPQKSSGL